MWQKRIHDFNVPTERKHIEKLRYIHRNHVTRELEERPQPWSFRLARARAFSRATTTLGCSRAPFSI
jgi:putative transposase